MKVFLSTLKMAVATFLSRILGLVREQVLAYMFGATGLTDAFLVAYRIPNLLRDLFAEGAFSAAFVPTFVKANLEDKEKARNLLWALFILLSIITLGIASIIFIFSPEIINLFAPTFKEDPRKFEVAVMLTRMMSPFLTFVSIAALFMGVLNSLKIFFIPSLAPAFFNIVMIISMLTLPVYFSSMGMEPILALGVGVFVGGLVQAAVQIPLILKHQFYPRMPKNIFSSETKKVVTLIGPGLIGFAATQINLLVNTILASGTVVGAVSWLSYGFRLFQLPVGILSVSIGNSNLVHFSTAWKQGDKKSAVEYLESSIFLSFFVVLPAMCALIVCNEEMINVIFERGAFTAMSTENTAKALKLYAIGLPFYSLYKILVPTFYAIDRQKVPVYTSIFAVGLNIIFCIYMTPIYGFEILALGTTLSMFINTIIQGIVLKKDIKLPWSIFINLRIAKVFLSFMITLFLTVELKQLLVFEGENFIYRASVLFIYLAFIAITYFSLCLVLGEKAALMDFLGKFKRTKK